MQTGPGPPPPPGDNNTGFGQPAGVAPPAALAPELAPLAMAAALANTGAVAAAVAEAKQQLGCAKCRYSRGGCARCRNPSFRPRVPPGLPGSRPRQQPRGAGGSADAGSGDMPAARPPARRIVSAKRPRLKAGAAKGLGAGEPLVHALRRQLQSLQTQSGSGSGSAPAADSAPALDVDAPAAGAAAAPAGTFQPAGNPHTSQQQQPLQPHQEQVPQQQQQLQSQGQQQQKRPRSAAAAGSRPAKFLKADPRLNSQPQQAEQQGASQQAAHPTAPPVEDSKRGASSEPSPSTRPLSKRQRTGPAPSAAQPAPAAAPPPMPLAAAAAADGAEGVAAEGPPGAGKRQGAEQRQQRPAKFRRLARGDEQPPAVVAQQRQQGMAAAAAQQEQAQPQAEEHELPQRSGGSGEGGEGMDVDLVSPRKRGAEEAAGEGQGGGAGAPAGPPSSADFLAKLREQMELRHQERQATQGGPAELPLLALPPKRAKRSPAKTAHSPAASLGRAAAAAAAGPAGVAGDAGGQAEPDPRLCLWEPPVSPYGLLEEELYDDPWKVLVACMLLNKTSGTAVRKVIWDLFALCPTPAAAVAADVQQIQALIQPLGLFRKRALAIQQLSQDYLYKEWRNPTELFGIGKYAADAYLMFCRGRWREVQPEDKDLRKYREWLEHTGGLGTGLSRHRTMPAASGTAGA